MGRLPTFQENNTLHYFKTSSMDNLEKRKSLVPARKQSAIPQLCSR